MTVFNKVKDKFIALRLKKNYHKNKDGIAKEGMSKKLVFTIFFILCIYQSIVAVMPLYFAFINSVKAQAEYVLDMVALPRVWRWELWAEIFPTFEVNQTSFWGMAWNSVWFSFGTQFMELAASVFVAYPLARYNFPGKEFFYGVIIFRITIPIVGMGAAGYKLARAIGAINNPVLQVVCAFSGFDYQALIVYGYVKAVGKEYSEAAVLDGANALQVLFMVVIPQAMPCIVALYVNAIMGSWNNYSSIMINLPKYPNLAYGIYLVSESSAHGANSKAKMFGCIMMSAIVPLTLFASCQKLMLNNMSVGGLKG